MVEKKKKFGYEFPNITCKLGNYYVNAADLYLPDGLADTYAKQFKSIPNHQMRKILDMVKDALALCDIDFNNAQKKMFMIVTMSAYNGGRMGNLRPLYNFIRNTISEKTIIDKRDIETFDQFFTSIVAYHKLVSK